MALSRLSISIDEFSPYTPTMKEDSGGSQSLGITAPYGEDWERPGPRIRTTNGPQGRSAIHE